MRVRQWVLACLLVLLPAVAEAAAKQFIVRTSCDNVEATASRCSLSVVRAINPSQGIWVLTPLSDTARTRDVLDCLSANTCVQTAELDSVAYLPGLASGTLLNSDTVPILDTLLTDPTSVNYYGSYAWNGYVQQTAAGIIRLPEAHQYFGSGAGTIAVIDTGVDPAHPVLSSSLLPGYNFISSDPVHYKQPTGSELGDLDPTTASVLAQSSTSMLNKTAVIVNGDTIAILDGDTVPILDASAIPSHFGHGTMVSGLIHLASPSSKILPLKAFKGDGTAMLSDIICAVYYAADYVGVKAINISFSMSEPSAELQSAINYANTKRVICSASAGNSGSQTMVYPAGWTKVMGVASTSDIDVRSTFSNYGDPLVYAAAPGEGVLTTYPYNNYAAVWGTSFSTALNTGAAGLLVGIDPKINQSQASYSLTSQAMPIPLQGLGAGRIDVYKACSYWFWKK